MNIKSYELESEPHEIIEDLFSIAKATRSSHGSMGIVVNGANNLLECTVLLKTFIMPNFEKRMRKHALPCQHVAGYEFRMSICDLIFEIKAKHGLFEEINTKAWLNLKT